jgi:hypothetical protein
MLSSGDRRGELRLYGRCRLAPANSRSFPFDKLRVRMTIFYLEPVHTGAATIVEGLAASMYTK